MKLLHTILELDRWIYSKLPCSFCVSLKEEDKIVCQIRTRSEVSHKIVENNFACQKCKEKFENGELPKCEKCNRLKTDSNVDIFSGKYVCDCEKEDEQEKELPVLPGEEREATFYERQINSLREEKDQLAVEAQTHLDAMEAFEVWNKEHRQQLLDRIKELEVENGNYKEEIQRLKIQLEQLNSRQTAQVEVKETKKWPWRLKK